MEKNKGKSLLLRLLSIFVLVLIGIIGIRFYYSSKAYTTEDWLGSWQVHYYYEPEIDLFYEGTLYISLNDSLSGYLEVYPPESTRSESLVLENLSISENNASMSGQIVHKSYRIKGGHLKEAFSLTFTKADELEGKGECLAYCAEGTVGAAIIWSGIKVTSLPRGDN